MCPRRSPNRDRTDARRPGTPAAERGAEVRQRLLDAAAAAIPERGWAGVSTRTLAARAGVPPGLVHYHFRSVQELLHMAAVQAVAQSLTEAHEVLTSAGDASAGLSVLLAQLDVHTGTDSRSLLFVETYLAAARDEALREDLRRLLLAFRATLEEHLSRSGVADPASTAAVVAAAVDGVLLHRAIDSTLTAAVVAPVLRRLLDPRTHP